MALIDAWESGKKPPKEVFREARASWLSGAWPRSFEPDHDAIGMEALYILAMARDFGLTDADISELRAFVGARDQANAQERFFAHWEATGTKVREAASRREDYYGPPAADGVDDMDFAYSDPDDRRLHRQVREDPETAWPELRLRLCSPHPRNDELLDDLVEDLMFNEPDRFIDRIETIADECPSARETIAWATIDGRASSPGLERFWTLQQRLRGLGSDVRLE